MLTVPSSGVLILFVFVLGVRYADYRSGNRDPVGDKEQKFWVLPFMAIVAAQLIFDLSDGYAKIAAAVIIVAYILRNWRASRTRQIAT